MKKIGKLLAVAVFTVVLAVSALFVSSAANSGKWIAAWGTAPTEIALSGYDNIAAIVEDATARTIITPTASGTKVRLKFSNYYGSSTLRIDSVTIANALSTTTNRDEITSDIDMNSLKIVTFNGGSPYVEIPKGKEVYSDAISFNVTAMKNIAVSMYVKNASELKTMGLSGGTTFLTFGGNKTRAESVGLGADIGTDIESKVILNLITNLLGLPFNMDLKLSYSIVNVVPCLATMDVYSDKDAYSVAVIGDSTVSNEFPMYLAKEINKVGVSNVGVMGKGILGNRLLGEGLGYVGLVFGESMIDRLSRDALKQSGVEYVIVKIGANDIMHPVCSDIQQQYPGIKQPTAKELEAGFSKVFKACHDAGMKVIVVGITQWKGNTRNYFNTGDKYIRTTKQFNADWQIALDVNEWLRTTSEHDGYVYYNDISQSANDPTAFRPEYTIDGAHPTDLLQQVWAKNFPLGLIGVTRRVGGVRLNATTATINVGKTKKLTATILPTNAENKKITWTSSKPSIATVDSNGKVTAVANGTTTITCKTADGGYKATCKVTVVTAPTGVKLSKTTATIYTTKTVKLSATVSPSTANDKTVKWSSSNKKVATVNSNGLVTGVGSGTATITCKTNTGSVKATCAVTVLKKTEVASVSLNLATKNIQKGKTFRLTATVSPAKATFKDVTWKSSNKAVATVDSNGKVTAIKAGTAYITCTSTDNTFISAKCKVVVKVKATGVKLSSTAITYVGYTKTLKAKISPSDATNTKVTWKSSNPKVVTVDSNGVITGVKKGTATITCTTKDGGYTAKCKVTVKTVVKSTKVKLDRANYTLKDGKSFTLTATVSPSDTTDKTVTWKSSNTKVVKVTKKGVVKAVAPGKATITCKTNDTGKTAKCVVTVKYVAVSSVKLNKASLTIDDGKTKTLKATISPSNATNKNVTWNSSDKKVATVDSSGKVKAVGPGKATITCTTKDGKKVAKCTVTVNRVKVTSVKLNKTSLKLAYGKTFTLKATISPANASNQKVTWKSSKTSVVKVNSKGVLTPVAKGTATITCTTADGSKKAKCTVEVTKNNVIGLKLSRTSIVMSVGNTSQLTVDVLPSNASDKTVKWSTTNSNVATVDSKGLVKAVGKGECYIKVKSADGRVTETCRVLVV